ncbi:hypothetical protein FQZ97_656660 [compost metagenome]
MGDFGAWYLAGLGAAAAGCALFLPQGLWGALGPRLSRLFTRSSVSPVSLPQERTAP